MHNMPITIIVKSVNELMTVQISKSSFGMQFTWLLPPETLQIGTLEKPCRSDNDLRLKLNDVFPSAIMGFYLRAYHNFAQPKMQPQDIYC